MILLDTNVISEPLRRVPEPNVVSWLDAQPLESLYVSAIAIAELRAGIAMLPAGKRRTGLRDNFEKQVLPIFTGRVLAFDIHCTQAYAEQMANAKKAGLAIAAADGFIAAIAKTHEFAVASRDEGPFRAAGIKVINPWIV